MNLRFLLKTLIIIMIAGLLTGCGSASTPANDPEEKSAGRIVYETKCSRCHKIDGAGGNKGPDLSHIGAKRDADWLDKWLQNPKSVKADAKMPTPKIDDQQRTDVIEYLGTRQ